MAVTITTDALLNALRLDDDIDIRAEITRLQLYSSEVVIRLAPDAVDTAHNQAIVQMVAWLFDRPAVGELPRQYANAFRNSGAGEILAPWRGEGVINVGTHGHDELAQIEANRLAIAAVEADEIARTLQNQLRINGNAQLISGLQTNIQTLQAEIEANTGNIANNVRVSAANAESVRTLGTRFDGSEDLQSVTVATASSYSGTLDSQQASAMPLLLVITADISGNRAGTAFDWSEGDVLYFPPQSVAPEFLFSIAGSDVDLTPYRTAALQDIVDGRATAGILLARQEAATADGKAVAAQEDADRNTAALRGKQDTPVAIADVTGLTVALENIPKPGIADPFISPTHWVHDLEPRTFNVHFDTAALAIRTATQVALNIGGTTVSQAIVENQHVYPFTFDATASGNISRNRRVGQTLAIAYRVLDATNAMLYEIHDLLPVVAMVPEPFVLMSDFNELLARVIALEPSEGIVLTQIWSVEDTDLSTPTNVQNEPLTPGTLYLLVYRIASRAGFWIFDGAAASGFRGWSYLNTSGRAASINFGYNSAAMGTIIFGDENASAALYTLA